MTMELPTTDQFLRARGNLNYAADRALLAHYAHSEYSANGFKTDCIKELKAAAKALGYELVEIVSTTAKDNDGNHIETTIPVTGLGRWPMRKPEDHLITSDREHAARIKKCCDDLLDAVSDAVDSGLAVSLSVTEFPTLGRLPVELIEAKISRPIDA